MLCRYRGSVAAAAVLCMLCLGVLVPASGRAADWPQWGGTPSRNMISEETGLPESFEPGRKQGGVIDPATTENVRWTAPLGGTAYGNPVIASGMVLVGTDGTTAEDDPRLRANPMGLLKCLDEATGGLRWQMIFPERKHGLNEQRHFGLQKLGICSSAAVVGDRIYVMGVAGDILCLDADGLADGNDGPFLGEAQYIAGHDQPPVELTPLDGDIIWRYDLIDELGVCPHDAVSCSVLVHGDVLYTNTSNGVGGEKGNHWTHMHDFPVNPKAPALVALDRHTGRLLAEEREGISRRLYHAEWSSPSLGEVNGQTLIFFGGGDGVCYAFEAVEPGGEAPTALRKAWSFDCNPPEYKFRDGKPIPYYDGDKRKSGGPNKQNDGTYVGPSQIIATPVFYKDRVYVAIGQDPAHGRGRGMFYCLDATGHGDVTQSACIWKYDGIERSISTASISGGLVYVPDVSGKLHCLDAETGALQSVYDTNAETWGGVLAVDGKLYMGNKRYFYCFRAGAEPELLSEIRLGSPVYTTPVAANGVLYVASQRYLWAVEQR